LEHVKKHFQEEAEVFDSLIKTLIPYYEDMISALVNCLPFHEKEKINILDLGCGTGNISLLVKKRFPMAHITCLDLSENMINQTKTKLENYGDIEYVLGDLRNLESYEKYHAVVSSLAIHHLSRNEQQTIYNKIYNALHEGGVFYNAENVDTDNNYLKKVYMNLWTKFMEQEHSKEEINKIWLPKHEQEDIPQPLMDHLKWLKKVGFKDVDVIWKYYNFGVYGGIK
jgi:tRNA (cmo5U34)-methyltransferase